MALGPAMTDEGGFISVGRTVWTVVSCLCRSPAGAVE